MAERFRVSHAVIAALCLAAGMLFGRWNGSKELARIGRAADSLDRAVDSLQAQIEWHRDTDSNAVETPILRARTIFVRAMSRSDSLALARARTDAAASDTNRLVAESALTREREIADAQIRGLQLAYVIQGQAVDTLKSRLAYYRDTALVRMTDQLSRAQQLLRESLAVPRRKRCGIGGAAPLVVSQAGMGLGLAAGVSCQL